MWRWGMSAGALGLALSGGVALAQTTPSDPPPPIVQNVDANGVDLVTGAFNLADPQAAIGPSTGGLARLYKNMKAEDNYYGAINSSGSTYTVSVGSSSESFSYSGTNIYSGGT